MTWRMLDLFSGIGGFSLAAQWCWGDELEIVAFCEIDKFCQRVLKKHWPNVPIIEDVRDVVYARLFGQTKQEEQTASIEQSSETLAFTESGKSRQSPESERWKDPCRRSQEIDLLTGGFPCQPFSVAGKRKGKEDNRFLWPEMLAVIKAVRPRWIVAENVPGIIRMALDDCLSDLEGEGYSTGTLVIPACAVNAPHRRDRVWIVAHANNPRWDTGGPAITSGRQETRTMFRTSGKRYGGNSWWSTEPNVGRGSDGFPSWLYRHCGRGLTYAESQRRIQVLRKLWTKDVSEALWSALGGHGRMEKAEVLFSIVCEYEKNPDKTRILLESEKALEGFVRSVWRKQKTYRSPYRSRQVEQQSSEHPDSLQMVSRFSAFDIETPWSIQNWEDGISRVSKGVKNRVDRLKSLGNAIVPQVAYQLFRFIKQIEDRP